MLRSGLMISTSGGGMKLDRDMIIKASPIDSRRMWMP